MPRSRRRPSATAVLATLLTVLLLAVAAPAVHVYHGLNAGIVVGPESCFVGAEWRGAPGLYANCGTPTPASVPVLPGDDDADSPTVEAAALRDHH